MLWPTIPDRDEKPEGAGNGEATEEAMAVYMKHCYPSDAQILARIREIQLQYVANTTVREDGTARTLDVLYLLTNGDREWLKGLTAELVKDGWGTVVTSKDLVLDDEQMDVGMAVDMEIARRAEVFVGNAVRGYLVSTMVYVLTNLQWSSYSSNVMHTRIRDGREPLGNRVF